MKISASLHAADPLRLADDLAAVAPHVGSLHIDIMDGRFAPAFGFGEQLIRRLIAEGAPPIDVHLMLEQPEPWARRFAGLGVRSVAFHLEAVAEVTQVAKSIREAGSLAYLALLPETPLARVAPFLADIDGVLLLTAPPGGGPCNPAALERVRHLPAALPTIVDGGLEPQHFNTLSSAGVALAVIGRALFGGPNLPETATELALLAAKG